MYDKRMAISLAVLEIQRQKWTGGILPPAAGVNSVSRQQRRRRQERNIKRLMRELLTGDVPSDLDLLRPQIYSPSYSCPALCFH